MSFDLLDYTLWPAAEAVALHYKRRGFRKKIERPMQQDDNYRPTLIFEKRLFTVEVVEIKREFRIDKTLYDFIQQCLAQQRPVKIWICVPDDEGNEPSIQVSEEKKFREKGVGRYYFDGSVVTEVQPAVECHLRFALPPGPKLIQQNRVNLAINKFNSGDRIGGIRDLGELLEEAVTNLGVHAKRKGKFTMVKNIDVFTDADFEGQIIKLGAGAAGIRLLEPAMVTDVRAAKNTRNLSSHPRDRRKQRQLEEQYKTKMGESIRLLREIERIKQAIR